MIKNKLILLVFLLFFLVNNSFSNSDIEVLEIYSPKYFNENNNVHKFINYISPEQLSFKVCLDENSEEISANLVCDNKLINLPLYEFDTEEKKTCFFSNYNLENMSCINNEFKFEIKYTLNNKEKSIIRNFKKQKESKLVPNILNQNYKSLNSLDLSYYLLALNLIETPNNIKSNEIYEILKNSRDNLGKCWPNRNCNVEYTSKILVNLFFAGYKLNTRILEDARIYLEQETMSTSNKQLDYAIHFKYNFQNSSQEIKCNLINDDKSAVSHNIYDNKKKISSYASSKISITCNETIDEIYLELKGIDGKSIYSDVIKNSKNFVYTIDKFACIERNGICSYEANLNALLLYGKNLKNYDLIKKYIDSSIMQKDLNSNLIKSDKDYFEIGKYLYFEKNDDLKNYLKFNQNNDGSWGLSSSNNLKIQDTVWSILGLEKSKEIDEYINDAKKWIYYSEPFNSWGNIEANSLAYLAINDQIKAYLRISNFNVIENFENIELENPSTYNLKGITIDFTDNLKNHISFKENLGDLDINKKINFNISLNDFFYGIKSGHMIINSLNNENKLEEIIRIPLTIKGPNPISIKEKQNVSINIEDNKILIPFEKNLNTFNLTCSFVNSLTNNEEKINLNEKLTYIEINNNLIESTLFKLDLNCNMDKISFKFPIELNISIASKSFEIDKDLIKISSYDDFSIKLTNIYSSRQIISFEIEGDLSDLIIINEKEKIIAKDDIRDIYFSINKNIPIENYLNSSQSYLLIKSENSYLTRVPIEISDFETNSNDSYMIWYIALGIFFFLLLFIVIIRFLRANREEDSQSNGAEYEEELFFDDPNELQFK